MSSQSSFAVVTGASSGIGLELSVIFARNGFDLLLCAEDDGLEAAAERCRQEGVAVATLQRNLRNPEEVEELYTVIVSTGRSVEAAAVNAGVGRGGTFVDTPFADLLEVVELNVVSTLYLTHKL
jgi:uncharacterized protein